METVSGGEPSFRQSRAFGGFTLTQVVYRAGASLPAHAHENVVLSFAITGGTIVSLGRLTEWCDGDSLLYLPAGAQHTNTYPEAATRLHVEVTARFWNDTATGRLTRASGGALRHAIPLELRRAVKDAFADVDNLAVFDVTMNLTDTIGLVTSRRTSARSMRPDHWLLRLREFLTAHCAEPLSLPELTRITGRHPVHISREFRQYFGKTISAFVRQRRLRRAAQLMRQDSLPLAAIAAECGFYDQSHFTNAFRQYAGMTPSAYRTSMRRPAGTRL